MRRLLVATDLSERTRMAERRAALIAKRKGWAIDLVHAVDSDQPPAVVHAHREAATSMLAEACAWLALESGHACQPRIALGDPSEALAAAARPEETAAIVLGPHRRRLIRDIFLGTTGERVIRAARVPVLSVHAAPEGPYRRMLLALDESPAATAVVTAVRNLGVVPAPEVTAVFVTEPPPSLMLRRAGASPADLNAATADARRDAHAVLDAVLPKAGFPCGREAIIELALSVPDTLMRAASRLGCDIIALGTRGRGSLERLALGSVAASVLARAAVDVLVVPTATGAGVSGHVPA
jgi:nucleotide-binding universal stress UspA family protein